MSVLGLCSDDPVVGTLRDVFGANILRVPEERYQPLAVLAAAGDRASFRGALGDLLQGAAPQFPPAARSQLPDLSGKKTKSVDLSLGLQVLAGFLTGLGAGSAGLDAKFQGVRQVSYSFRDVARSWVDLDALGKALEGRAVDRRNPAASIFFGKDAPYAFLVIDSVITSPDFTIVADRTSDPSFRFDVPGVQAALGASAGVTVSTTGGTDLTFKGVKRLAFAFSCVHFALGSGGKIGAILPDDEVRQVSLFARPARGQSGEYARNRVLLTKDVGMVEVG
ncbi:MAG TPA: hypothetical protein VFK78_08325 [Gemmatimonadales bacterium]|nr:hypothetical protein [Gemmatimonadales bacterium]